MKSSDLPFWRRLSQHGAAAALVDGRTSNVTTYAELDGIARHYASRISSAEKELVFLFCDADTDGIAIYLACLLAGQAVFIANPQSSRQHTIGLLELYRPEVVIARLEYMESLHSVDYAPRDSFGGYCVLQRRQVADQPPHALLALLLSTSASTGSPKLVRHGARAVEANSRQIVEALKITADDRAVISLPLHYVYGLSVLNSHLAAGASVILQSWPSASLNFWQGLTTASATTLPAVSYTIECMRELAVSRAAIPTLRKLLHSGSRLSPKSIAWIREELVQRGTDVYLMYGQTEACGRMTVLPPEHFDKAPSVGLPVECARVQVTEDGQVLFFGPNVMLGYALSRNCMNLGDELDGRLATGDSGFLDADGMLLLSGRRDRVCKILSHRINLDELEADLARLSEIVLMEFRGCVAVVAEGRSPERRSRVLQRIIEIRLPPNAFLFFELPAIPRGPAGKVDFAGLRSVLENSDSQ